MKTVFLFFIILIFCFSSYSQGLTNSPYSLFGIGELSKLGFNRSRAMGGVGFALSSKNDLNDINPASISYIDSTAFLFDVGGIANFTSLKSTDGSRSIEDYNFDHVAFGFSINKWWNTSLTLRKLSNIDYDLTIPLQNENTFYAEKYNASGGLNRIEMGNSLRYKNFSVGVGIGYVWGKISLSNALDILKGVDFLQVSRLNTKNFALSFGFQYENMLNNNDKLIIGGVYKPKTDITDSYEKVSYQIYGSTSDTVDYIQQSNRSVELPLTYGIGFAFVRNNKLIIAADYMHQAWSKTTFFGDLETLKNSNYFGVGVEYIPNPISLKKYIERVSYRAGMYYNSSYLEVNGHPINEFGFTLGMGLPLRSTQLNIAFELGQKGTKKDNLIEERFVKINVGFKLQELWFFKILYD